MDKLRFRPHRATVALGAVIFALAGAAFLALGRGNQALASHVSCGDKITTDTRLDSDLTDCPNNGIVIGADGITLDLNGHLIDGDGTPFAACPRRKFCDGGVISVGHDGITVVGGSVREFDAGVLVGNAAAAACWAFPRRGTASSASCSLTPPEAWSATAPEATTSLPTATGWACSTRTTSASWTTHSGTTPRLRLTPASTSTNPPTT
jgi:hypothetical protein